MKRGMKLVFFALALAAVFGAAFALGAAVDEGGQALPVRAGQAS